MTRILHTRAFKSGNSVAVRLPKELAITAGMELELVEQGGVVTIRPKPKLTTRELIEELRRIGTPPDGVQQREPFEYPDRPGL